MDKVAEDLRHNFKKNIWKEYRKAWYALDNPNGIKKIVHATMLTFADLNLKKLARLNLD